MLGSVSAFYEPDAVIMAAGITAAVTIGLTLFAFRPNGTSPPAEASYFSDIATLSMTCSPVRLHYCYPNAHCISSMTKLRTACYAIHISSTYV